MFENVFYMIFARWNGLLRYSKLDYGQTKFLQIAIC